jgi:uncharacterized membrane protein YfcA
MLWELMTDFFLFVLIGTGVTFFQLFIMKRDFPGKVLPPLVIALIGSFSGSLVGSSILTRFDINSLWILTASALVFSALFLQIFYSLSRVKEFY